MHFPNHISSQDHEKKNTTYKDSRQNKLHSSVTKTLKIMVSSTY